MRIAYNPLYKPDGVTLVGALQNAPTNDDITFDLPGKAIYAKRIKFKGTDNTYDFNHDGNLTITTTARPDDKTDVTIGVDIQQIRLALLLQWDIIASKASFSLTTSWTDSKVDLSNLATGSYLINIDYDNLIFTGTFSILNNFCTVSEEIPLHMCGDNSALNRGHIFARLFVTSNNTLQLQIAADVPEQNIPRFVIRIKALGIL